TSRLEDAYNELELLGYPLSMSMFDLLRTPFRGDIKVRDMPQHIGKTVRMVANFACEKTVRTKNNKKMWFGTFLDTEGDFLDTIHFPGSSTYNPFRGNGCYLISGKVVEDFGFTSLEVAQIAKLPILDNPVLS